MGGTLDEKLAKIKVAGYDGFEDEYYKGRRPNGVYIPRFCYHPRMNPVGMCRMCLVEVDSGRGPALQPSCMIECAPDMVVTTDSDLVKKVQDGVLEYLLINHPLDCPVCDKGGECPLQDQTMSHGPGESRYVEEKRHAEKPIPVSAFTLLMGRRNLCGSNIGGITEAQEMLDFCGQHNITADVEVIAIQQINEAYERVLKSDVRYRFVIDIASLDERLARSAMMARLDGEIGVRTLQG